MATHDKVIDDREPGDPDDRTGLGSAAPCDRARQPFSEPFSLYRRGC